MTPNLVDIVRSPNWLCFGLEQRSLMLHFLQVDECTIDQATFLDQRWLDASSTVAFPLADVRAALDAGDAGKHAATQSRFIVHTAFCCSTLLARCMQVPGRIRVLRELTIFSALAGLREQLHGSGNDQAWATVVDTVDRLTSRAFGDAPTINKPSNVFLATSADFLAARAGNRAVLIHMDLPSFLMSCLKKSQAGAGPWQGMYAALDPTGSYARQRGIDVETAPPLQLAATLWHLQMSLLRAYQAAGVTSRVRQVDVGEFLAAPLETVRRGLDWFELGHRADEATLAGIVAQTLQSNAKQTGQQFSPGQRRKEQALIRGHFRAPIAQAMAWSDERFGPWQDAYPSSIPRLLDSSRD